MGRRSRPRWRYRSCFGTEINKVSSHPTIGNGGGLTRFLAGVVRYRRREPAVIIAVLNLKGGCGKSTIAVNLACELAGGSDSVLLLDNDSQGTATHWMSHGRLPVRGEFMPLENDADGERLVQAVAARSERYVVLDAPAHVQAATLAAGKIADLVLVPVTASVVDLVATEAVVNLIRQARVLRRGDTPKCLIIPSKIDRRTDAGRQIDEQVRRYRRERWAGDSPAHGVCGGLRSGTVDRRIRSPEPGPLRHHSARHGGEEEPPDMKPADLPGSTAGTGPAAPNGTTRATRKKPAKTVGHGGGVHRGRAPAPLAGAGCRRRGRGRRCADVAASIGGVVSSPMCRLRLRPGAVSPSSGTTGFRRPISCHPARRRSIAWMLPDSSRPALAAVGPKVPQSGLRLLGGTLGRFAGKKEANEFIAGGIDGQSGVSGDCREEGGSPRGTLPRARARASIRRNSTAPSAICNLS